MSGTNHVALDPFAGAAMNLLEQARRLDDAQRQRVAVTQNAHPVSLSDAYRIQHAVLDLRIARGERVIGAKLGFTSRAKMTQMGVSDVIVGQLTDAMIVPDGGTVDLGRFIHPRIEPEVAFLLGADVDPAGPGAALVAAISAVAPAMEIIDSRYRDFRFNLSDVIADNTSAAACVLGPWQPIVGVGDFGDRTVRLYADGVERQTGSTAAILGHPLTAMAELAEMARQYAVALRPGDIVLAGAATEAIPFGVGHYETRVTGLGTASVRGVDA